MHVEQKRIFIGNLPVSIKEDDIKLQFAQYGSIVSVDIKHRKDSTTQHTSSVFAFVNIEINNRKLNQCFQELPRQEKWQGHHVKLELAKESFLERLKREREESQNKLTKSNESAKSETSNINYTRTVLNASNSKKVYHSSESDNSIGECNDIGIKNNVTVTQKNNHEEADENDSIAFIIKNNKNKTILDQIKIESVNRPVHVITEIKTNELKDRRSIEADDKRRKSLQQMKSCYQSQKNAIKLALSSIDSKTKNKITFDDDLTYKKNNKRKHEDNFSNYQRANEYSKKKKVNLFAEDTQDDDDINFQIKKQFEGKSGQKLLELQSRFTNDKRFTLDSRFLEDEDNEGGGSDQLQQNEKQEQINILETVLGHKLRISSKTESNRNENMPESMIRYDPTRPEHSKFEIKQKQNKDELAEKGKKNKDKRSIEEKSQVVEKNIEVSQEKFYKVTDVLKKSLQEKENFSLLNLFGKAKDEEEKQTNKDEIKELKKRKQFDDQNPFKYDSSDTEDEYTNRTKKKSITTQSENSKNIPSSSWIERFFFQDNDERLKEGLTFLEKVFEPNAKPFKETRSKLKQVIRDKVRNRLRNNKPFQKRLGRHKMIKVKKALKK